VPEVIEILQVNAAFSEVTTRYINRIVIESIGFDLSDYFNYWAAENALPVPFEGNITGFFYRTAASTRASPPQSLALTFASIDAPKGSAAFILDIDITQKLGGPSSAEEAIEQLVALKAFENEIFESLITDKCRDLFK
jgi:uncharacterized protein (TIGR04255 family)